jgi:hypothetical protein
MDGLGGSMDRWKYGSVEGWMYWWIGLPMDVRMNGWMSKLMAVG